MHGFDAETLAKRVSQEAKPSCYTKLGKTNGEHVVHVVGRSEGYRRSITLKNLAAWLTHDWNKNA